MPEKVKLAAAVLLSAGGPESIEVFGATVSIRPGEAGRVASTLPAWSIARTSKLWALGEPGIGLRRGAGGEVRAVDRRHSKEATPEPPVSVPEKVKLAAAEAALAGGQESIEVFGAAVSTVQVKVAGVASTFPAWSIALTSKVWEPSASPE